MKQRVSGFEAWGERKLARKRFEVKTDVNDRN